MMSLSAEQVSHIAKLTRLGLTSTASVQAAQDLSKILDHFATIKDIDTRGVPTYDNATGLTNVSRADTAAIGQHGASTALLAAAPAVLEEHVKVQAVLGE